MKRTTLRNALAASVLATVSGFAVQAGAAPTFTFIEVAGFNNTGTNSIPYVNPGLVYENPIAVGDPNSPQNFVDCGFPPCVGEASGSDLYQVLRWRVPPGSNGNTSTLEVSNNPLVPAGNVDGNLSDISTDWVDISRVTHTNNVINGVFDWGPQDLWGRFILTDNEGGAQVVLDSSAPITISFNETLNVASPGICVETNPLGSQCDDYFVYDAAGFGQIPFVANNGSNWVVQFRLDPDSCTISGCVNEEPRVYTEETAQSWIDVQARLVCVEQDPRFEDCGTNEVPEPSMLALVGLGLLGVGFVGWRRQKGNIA